MIVIAVFNEIEFYSRVTVYIICYYAIKMKTYNETHTRVNIIKKKIVPIYRKSVILYKCFGR